MGTGTGLSVLQSQHRVKGLGFTNSVIQRCPSFFLSLSLTASWLQHPPTLTTKRNAGFQMSTSKTVVASTALRCILHVLHPARAWCRQINCSAEIPPQETTKLSKLKYVTRHKLRGEEYCTSPSTFLHVHKPNQWEKHVKHECAESFASHGILIH